MTLRTLLSPTSTRPPTRCARWAVWVAVPSALLGVCLAFTLPAWASSDDRADHDAAREALVRGQVMPLKNVLEHLARQRPGGQILEVELEKKRGRWIYEIKQMSPSGQLVKLKLDAQTGELLNDQPTRPAPAPAQGKP